MKRLTTLLITIFALSMLVILPVYAHGGKDDPQHHKHATKTPCATATPHPVQTPQHPHPTQTPQHPHPTQIPQHLHPTQTPQHPHPEQTPQHPHPEQTPQHLHPTQTPQHPHPTQTPPHSHTHTHQIPQHPQPVPHTGDYVNLRSTIQAQENNSWMIGDVLVTITDTTIINERYGPAEIGALVNVKAFRQEDGSLYAHRITVMANNQYQTNSISWIGELEAMEDDLWTIGGRDVVVDANTLLITNNGPLEIGSTVQVHALQLEDGTLWARRIETKD